MKKLAIVSLFLLIFSGCSKSDINEDEEGDVNPKSLEYAIPLPEDSEWAEEIL